MRFFLALMSLFLGAFPAGAQRRGPLVLAAASLQEAVGDAAEDWARRGHARPVVLFAASSALARQVLAGAPADLFISADNAWMDAVERAGLVRPGTRTVLAENVLVVVTGAGSRSRGDLGLARALSGGAVAMADPSAVPAGRYGEQALRRLGAWTAVAPHEVRAENVRAALALVERGAAPYGIVYATDARSSAKVRVVSVFPARSHAPIVYPLARLTASRDPGAEEFRRFLLSRAGKDILVRHGFTVR